MPDPFYRSHWRQIEDDRLAAYRNGFNWDERSEALYRQAGIGTGQAIADFGCGPGKVAVELARRVGPDGFVHAIDINSDFLGMADANAKKAGVSDRFQTHLSDGKSFPPDLTSLDRITARNTLMYVDDAAQMLLQFRAALRPGGIAHAIDGDWFMIVAEPIEHKVWRAFVESASHACRRADMGRRLYSAFSRSGFRELEISIHAAADTDGRLLPMIANMATYAAGSGAISSDQAIGIVEEMKRALDQGTYFVVSPQFVVSGKRPL